MHGYLGTVSQWEILFILLLELLKFVLTTSGCDGFASRIIFAVFLLLFLNIFWAVIGSMWSFALHWNSTCSTDTIGCAAHIKCLVAKCVVRHCVPNNDWVSLLCLLICANERESDIREAVLTAAQRVRNQLTPRRPSCRACSNIVASLYAFVTHFLPSNANVIVLLVLPTGIVRYSQLIDERLLKELTSFLQKHTEGSNARPWLVYFWLVTFPLWYTHAAVDRCVVWQRCELSLWIYKKLVPRYKLLTSEHPGYLVISGLRCFHGSRQFVYCFVFETLR